jgi:predicted tellurium resistance membrane protein TerC
MIKVLLLILSPFKTWEKIAEKNRGFLAVSILFVLPLIFIAAAGEGYGLLRWGEKRGEFAHISKVTRELALRYEIVQIALALIILFVGAQLLLSVARSFQLNATFSQAYSTVAYGFSPLFAVQLLDGIPMVNTWICWGLGAILSMTVLYHGVALMLKPDQTKGFGIYLTTVIFMLIFSGLAHFVAWSVLQEKLLKNGIPHLPM